MAKETRAENGREKKNLIITGISGASGTIYAIRFLKVIKEMGFESEVIVTRGAIKVAEKECGIDLVSNINEFSFPVYMEDEIEAPPSSSSHTVKAIGMAIVPCSIRTLAEIASGIASNLLVRTALNFLRTRSRLVLLLRETPLGVIELENALKVAQAGGIILPASPGYYHHPKNIQDLIDFVVGKILDMLEVENNIYKHWGEDSTQSQGLCDRIS
ncbi:UbiX family flavin prenyltransferase [Stygiolobus caldivivus]|uniref:Flavin prenyltransferase UbiX n=1 Tax=Stygiolobus caldivivus TaxID=2824673 RepID=A0A8D5U866_9CREN|nr:UbiX family flavin prenyltransferase [Stygiolobus caldivivus]BCU70718.1 aromatic acid decarboxylase [Stygiolobus caldivivus]